MATVTLRVFDALESILGKKEVEVKGFLLKDVIDSLILKHGEKFKRKILDNTGNLQRFIRIYINGKDIRFLDQFNTSLNDGDEVLILPAVTGG